jgi:TRAP-type C4-dicarboxylate transport system substrate-binding protein
VYCTPLAAIALQWFTKTEYVSKVPMANGIGALVVTNRFFSKLPTDLQKILKETGSEAGKKLIQATRDDNDKSIDVLKEKGLKFVFGKEDVDINELYAIRDDAAAELASDGYIPKDVFERTRALLEKYRSKPVAGSMGSSSTGL